MKTRIINSATGATFGTVHILATATARVAERAEANIKSFALGNDKEETIALRRSKTDNRLAATERAIDRTAERADRLRAKMATYLPEVTIKKPEAFRKAPVNEPEVIIVSEKMIEYKPAK